MTIHGRPNPPSGWKGGFLTEYPECAYPKPNLGKLALTENMKNIDKLTRQQKVLWPEFSWETAPGDRSSRCFSMFAPDISRLGYDDRGQSWSIICPQQGVVVDDIGALNVEVTVTGQRGWAVETAPWVEGNQECAADMCVVGTIWFSPSAHQNPLVKLAWEFFERESLPFPSDKANAIKVTTHAVGSDDQIWFSLRKGESNQFDSPEFARHWKDGAWAVGNLSVEIGAIEKRNIEKVDNLNQKVLDIFNEASGNMLQKDNVLTWDVWFDTPEVVDQQEWKTHAERWRHSIDVDHGKSPDGQVATSPKFFDGREFKPTVDKVKEFEECVRLLMDL